jgi:hypothetical protein
LNEFILKSVMTSKVIVELGRARGWSNEDIVKRRTELQFNLVKAPELEKLARQLITNPSGAKITGPRIARRKGVELHELLNSFALTAD